MLALASAAWGQAEPAATPKPATKPAAKPAAKPAVKHTQAHPAHPAAPAAPAAPAPPAQAAAAPAGEAIPLIYSPWTKFCMKPPQGNAKQVCFTGKDGRIESGMPVVAAVIIEPEGEAKKLLRVTLPLTMALQMGTRILVDQGQPVTMPYVFCVQLGCMADYEATPALIASMKKGQNLFVQGMQMNGQPLTLALPLAEFEKSYDGAPLDPKEVAERQKSVQQELQKKADEAQKKLQNQGQPPAAAGAPSASAK